MTDFLEYAIWRLWPFSVADVVFYAALFAFFFVWLEVKDRKAARG